MKYFYSFLESNQTLIRTLFSNEFKNKLEESYDIDIKYDVDKITIDIELIVEPGTLDVSVDVTFIITINNINSFNVKYDYYSEIEDHDKDLISNTTEYYHKGEISFTSINNFLKWITKLEEKINNDINNIVYY